MKKPIPWAVALVSIMYWGALIWWQYDALFGSVTEQMNQNATIALVLSVVYVAMFLLFLILTIHLKVIAKKLDLNGVSENKLFMMIWIWLSEG